MSLDANYLLIYDNLPYIKPTPMEKDIQYLKEKYGGHFECIECSTVYWEKPKYILLPEEYENLMADQILERRNGELWGIIKW